MIAKKNKDKAIYKNKNGDCGIDQRGFDSLKAEKINTLQSRIDGLEYFIDADVKEMQRDKEKE